MSHAIVVKSFSELADILELETQPSLPSAIINEQCPGNPDAEPIGDLASLLAELEAASAMLATISRQDQETRAVALRDLEQYDALVAEQRQAEQAVEGAGQVRREAEALVIHAFAEEARAAASRVAALAAKAEANAAVLAEQCRREVERLAVEIDLERLLLERQLQEEAEKAKAAAAEVAERLSGALARAKAALEAGQFEEARGALENVGSDNPINPEIASLIAIITQRELAVKISGAEEILWRARREFRRDPAGVVARLESLDVDGLPEPLARQIFGEWARACSRLCRDRGLVAPLRYAPDPGRGAVLARESTATPYVVVSSLGMGAAWHPGKVVDDRNVRRARPLR